MLELEQILRANEINFAILAALPAFFLTLGMLALLRTWVKQVVIFILYETHCAQSMMQLLSSLSRLI